MKSSLRGLLRLIFSKVGLEYIRIGSRSFVVRDNNFYFPQIRRRYIFFGLDVDVLYDIGAQVGGWSLYLRNRGYGGEVVCFEPNPNTYEILQRRTEKYDNWVNYNCAIGDREYSETLMIMGKLGQSSSLLKPAHPGLMVESTVDVNVYPLSRFFDIHGLNNSFIKIDAQGYEYIILMGAADYLTEVSGIYLEVSLQRDYLGQSTFEELHSLLVDKSFALIHVEPGYIDPETGMMREMNCLYVNRIMM